MQYKLAHQKPKMATFVTEYDVLYIYEKREAEKEVLVGLNRSVQLSWCPVLQDKYVQWTCNDFRSEYRVHYIELIDFWSVDDLIPDQHG